MDNGTYIFGIVVVGNLIMFLAMIVGSYVKRNDVPKNAIGEELENE